MYVAKLFSWNCITYTNWLVFKKFKSFSYSKNKYRIIIVICFKSYYELHYNIHIVIIRSKSLRLDKMAHTITIYNTIVITYIHTDKHTLFVTWACLMYVRMQHAEISTHYHMHIVRISNNLECCKISTVESRIAYMWTHIHKKILSYLRINKKFELTKMIILLRITLDKQTSTETFQRICMHVYFPLNNVRYCILLNLCVDSTIITTY